MSSTVFLPMCQAILKFFSPPNSFKPITHAVLIYGMHRPQCFAVEGVFLRLLVDYIFPLAKGRNAIFMFNFRLNANGDPTTAVPLKIKVLQIL